MTINLENFTVDQDSNGDYVVTYDPTGTVIERIDSGNEEKILEVATQISTLKDATSGNQVYDSSSEELTADVNNQAVSTERLTNVYDRIVTPSDDLATILNTATTGTSIWIGPGVHTLTLDANDAGATITADNITVYLASGAEIKLADNQTSATSTNGGLLVAGSGISDLTITGPGTLDGNKTNNDELNNPANFGLVRAGDNVSGLTVTGVTVRESPGDAVRPRGTSGNEITDVVVRDCSITGNVEGVIWNYADDVRVIDNRIENTTVQDAIEPVESTGWLIRGNRIDGATQSGIDVYSNANDGTIADNYITGVNTGVYFSNDGGNADIDIHDNRIVGAGSAGVTVGSFEKSDINIHDNQISGCGGQGITISGGTGVDVSGNQCWANDLQGIRHMGDDCSIDDNRCWNNGQSGSGDRGIRAGGDHQDLKGNQCYDTQSTPTQAFGIQAEGTSQFVHGNHCWDNGTSQLVDQTDAASVVSDNMTA